MKTNQSFRFPFLILSISLVLILFSLSAIAQVKTWQGTITIPTYGWEDDVNPKFWGMEGGAKGSTTVRASIVYPYCMQDHLSRKLEDVTYKAIYLENEYLKITCLPELGGRLHSVYDKTTNHEVFHKNSVIKPSMIGMRGAFISGGVEWNAGPQLPGTRFIYPMSLGTDHFGVEFFNWPVNKGKDLSWTKNYADAASIFAVNCGYDFFGAYDADLDRGVIQVANHFEHTGKTEAIRQMVR